MRALLLMVFMFSLSCWGQSNPPAPAPREGAGHPQEKATQPDEKRKAEEVNAQTLAFAFGNLAALRTEYQAYVDRKHEEEKSNNEAILAYGTAALAIFTFALAFYTARLWSDAKKSAERQLRAYLMLPKITSEESISAIEIKVIVPMQNFGQTPAHQCTFWADFTVDVIPLGVPLIQGPSADIGSVGVIPPTGTFSAHLSFPRFDEIKVVGNTTLYIFGRIEYIDVFDKSHWTEFRFYKQTPWNVGEWNIHAQGNDAD